MISKSIYTFVFLVASMFVLPCIAQADDKSYLALVVKGEVNEALFQKIKNYVDAGGKTIVVTSEGGDARFGQQIAMTIVDKDISVVVRKYCLSSCANYLFLGAKNKQLEPDSILGFHGGVPTSYDDKKGSEVDLKQENLLKEQLATLVNAEQGFFKKIGVDHQLISDSFELTKGEKNLLKIEFPEDKYPSKTVLDDQYELIADYLLEIRSRDPEVSFKLSRENEIRNTLYFPSYAVLRKYGVKGIIEYPYPKDQCELDVWIKNISDDFDSIFAVGDFSQTGFKNVNQR
ncbi:hypothetical protein ACO0K0_04565 [Undibacterium sp. SXout11W]